MAHRLELDHNFNIHTGISDYYNMLFISQCFEHEALRVYVCKYVCLLTIQEQLRWTSPDFQGSSSGPRDIFRCKKFGARVLGMGPHLIISGPAYAATWSLVLDSCRCIFPIMRCYTAVWLLAHRRPVSPRIIWAGSLEFPWPYFPVICAKCIDFTHMSVFMSAYVCMFVRLLLGNRRSDFQIFRVAPRRWFRRNVGGYRNEKFGVLSLCHWTDHAPLLAD